MFHPRSLKVYLLVFLVVGSMIGLSGCAPLVFMAANPIVTAAIVAAIPAIITVYSNARLSGDQTRIKRLEAETARTTAISNAAEKLNQQVVSQRRLELELIEKADKATDPAMKQQMVDLQAKLAQDQQVISQTLNTANQEATQLANDTEKLPGSGSTLGSSSAAATSAGPIAPTPTAAPLTTDPAVATAPASNAAVSTVPGTVPAPVGAPIAPVSSLPAPRNTGTPGAAVPGTATANTAPPVFGVPAGGM